MKSELKIRAKSWGAGLGTRGCIGIHEDGSAWKYNCIYNIGKKNEISYLHVLSNSGHNANRICIFFTSNLICGSNYPGL